MRMKPEEAIEIIKIAIAEVEWDYPIDYAVAFEEAVNVLEKQIPKKPSQDSIGLYYFPTCPNCHKELESYDHHCECGQALDWEGLE